MTKMKKSNFDVDAFFRSFAIYRKYSKMIKISNKEIKISHKDSPSIWNKWINRCKNIK